jgi:simple sugar transport system ATP-binding protein
MSGGEKQALAIGRAMYFGARVLILDEPTSALGVKESEIVLRLIMKAKARGVAVVFITHSVQHAMTVGDRYIVLIHGEVAADFRRGEKSREEILDLMAGGEQLRELALEVEHLEAGALEADAV